MRKTAPPASNSVVELVAGRYVKAVNRIWGTKVGEYLSAPDGRRHLWHACFASGHPSFRWQTAAAATRLYDRLTYAPGKELAAQAYGDCPPGLLGCLGRLGAEPRSGYTYRALVQVLQRVQDVGWYLEQIEAVDGESVSEKTQQQVTEACSRSPVMCACEPNGFDSAFLEKILSAVT